jgi:hypothetical protein
MSSVAPFLEDGKSRNGNAWYRYLGHVTRQDIASDGSAVPTRDRFLKKSEWVSLGLRLTSQYVVFPKRLLQLHTGGVPALILKNTRISGGTRFHGW